MSLTTLIPAFDDFDRLAFDLIVADFDVETQPLGEPQPDPEPTARVFRLSRAAERRAGRESADRQLGIVRHRTREREV